MDKNKVQKIYSRNIPKIPKIKYLKMNNDNNIDKRKIRKIVKIIVVLTIACMIVNSVINIVEPIIDLQSVIMAKSVATKVSNEQSKKVMEDYQYEDLVNITKDNKGNITMISANVTTVNKMVSDISTKIQKELDEIENTKMYIRLGTFTGSKMLAGRGPKVEIIIFAIGDVQTELKSEFKAAGINQTIHRIYLELKTNVVILTPINNLQEEITTQVLLAEGVIIGEIPSTYYNLEGITKENVVDLIE